MNDINLPQLEKFSPLLKFKLAISAIYDFIGLIGYIASICTLITLLIMSVPKLIK